MGATRQSTNPTKARAYTLTLRNMEGVSQDYGAKPVISLSRTLRDVLPTRLSLEDMRNLVHFNRSLTVTTRVLSVQEYKNLMGRLTALGYRQENS